MSELAPNLKKGKAIFRNKCHQHYRLQLELKETRIMKTIKLLRDNNKETNWQKRQDKSTTYDKSKIE